MVSNFISEVRVKQPNIKGCGFKNFRKGVCESLIEVSYEETRESKLGKHHRTLSEVEKVHIGSKCKV